MLKCKECGGTNIHVKVWVDANTNEYKNSVNDDGDEDDNWCEDCKVHTQFEFVVEKTAETVLAAARANNEPVFVIRARDKAAIRALNSYIAECDGLNCNLEHLSGVEDIIDDFKQFAEDNPDQMKVPD